MSWQPHLMLTTGSERDWIAIRALLPLSDSGTAEECRRILPKGANPRDHRRFSPAKSAKAMENELRGVLTISKPVTMATANLVPFGRHCLAETQALLESKGREMTRRACLVQSQ
jgi:hypothetical protein